MKCWVLWVQSKIPFCVLKLLRKIWKVKKNKRKKRNIRRGQSGKCLKLQHTQQTHTRPLSCVSGCGQKVRSNKGFCRILVPLSNSQAISPSQQQLASPSMTACLTSQEKQLRWKKAKSLSLRNALEKRREDVHFVFEDAAVFT